MPHSLLDDSGCLGSHAELERELENRRDFSELVLLGASSLPRLPYSLWRVNQALLLEIGPCKDVNYLHNILALS